MRRTTTGRNWIAAALVAAGLSALSASTASAHCDTMSGPVVTAARNALSTGNVNLALIWVQPGDEAAVRREFTQALGARAAGGAAREAADTRFFESLVRIHRAGEGAPYTGVKPAGTPVGPAVEAADRSLEAGLSDPLQSVLADAVRGGVDRRFREVIDRRGYRPEDVSAGREYVKAYVGYTHLAEGLYDQAASTAGAAHAADAGHAGHTATSSHAGHLPWLLAGVFGLSLAGETAWLARLRRRR